MEKETEISFISVSGLSILSEAQNLMKTDLKFKHHSKQVHRTLNLFEVPGII